MQIDKYRQRERHQVKSESTVNSRVSAIKNLEQYMNHSGEPNPEDVEDWIDNLIQRFENDEIKAGTIKQYYKAVKYYFNKVHGGAEEIKHVRDWIPVGNTDHGDYLTKEELDEFRMNILSARDRCIVEMLYWYARRPSEVIMLNMEDIEMPTYDNNGEKIESGTIKFPILKKDTDQRATYEILDIVEKRLKSYLNYRTPVEVEAQQTWEEGTVEPLFTTNHGRISYDTVRSRFKSASNQLDIDKTITPKSMRHTRTTHLDRAGKDPAVIARQQLVHNPDSDVVGNYVHPRDDDDVRTVMKEDDE